MINNNDILRGRETAIAKDFFKVHVEIPKHKYLLHMVKYVVAVEINKSGKYSNYDEFCKYIEEINSETLLKVEIKKISSRELRLLVSGKGLLAVDIRRLLNKKCHINNIFLNKIEIKYFPVMSDTEMREYVKNVQRYLFFERDNPPECERVENKEFALYGKFLRYTYKLYKIVGFGGNIYNLELVSDSVVDSQSDDVLYKDVSQMLEILENIGLGNYVEIPELVFKGGTMPSGRIIAKRLLRQQAKAVRAKQIALDKIKQFGFIPYFDLAKLFFYNNSKTAALKMASKFIVKGGFTKKTDSSGQFIVCAA